MGYTHYYLENYSDAIQAFLKADNARKKGDNFIATVANVMIAFNFALMRSFESVLDYKKDAENYYALAKDHVTLKQYQKLQCLVDLINAIANQEFKKAQYMLQSYHALEPVKHSFDQGLHLIDLKNVRKIKKYNIESQEILKKLKKDDSEEEPLILEENEP